MNGFTCLLINLVVSLQNNFNTNNPIIRMQIRLTQSGGLAGKKMTALVNVLLTEKQWNLLIAAVKSNGAKNSKSKDAFTYTLQKNEEEETKKSIDISAIPDAYNDLFKKLFEGLKPAA